MILPNLFKIEPVRIPHIGEIGMKAYQFVQLGENITERMKTRLALGLDRFGNAMAPLSPKYQKRKVQKGGAPIRDMRNTGIMLGQMGPIDSSDSHVSVSFRGAASPVKARTRQRRDAFMGLSPLELAQTDEEITRYYAQNIKSAQLRTPGLGR